MRILLLIPLSILVFYLSWQGLKSESLPHKTIHHDTNSPALQHFSNSTLQHSAALQPLTFICDRLSDSLELVKFYNATGGPNWWTKWDLRKPIDSWFGINISTEGCITSIDLQDSLFNTCCRGNNLIGQLPSLNLPFLSFLRLSINHLSGAIPNFDKLPNLSALQLNNNQLTGSIPNFDRLPRLYTLELNDNQLKGSIPNFDKLPILSRLFLNNNQLTGSIPNFDKLPNLQLLILGNNQLTGSIPIFDKLPNLILLELNDNQLTGSIPNFDKLPNLYGLFLNNNQLTGSIPNFDKIPILRNLELYNNQLVGSIPNFDRLPRLYALDLNDNQLTGSIPSFDKLLNLSFLRFYNNQLTGSVPNFDNLVNLQRLYLWIQNNKFTFSCLIKNLNKIKTLTDTLVYAPQQKIYYDTTILITPNTFYTLDLLIDDTVTTSTYNWYKNDVLYKTIKGSNKLPFTPFTSNDAGTYTVKITNPLAPQLTLESWPIRLNALPMLVCDRRSDSLELVKFYNATGGANWWKKWDLKKPMDSWFGISLNAEGCVSEINLRDSILNRGCCAFIGNNLIGSIVPLNLPNLTVLNLNYNKLTGVIPNFSQLANLVTLELGANQLNDSIPNFDKIPNLTYLGLYHNRLKGSIPNFDKLPKLLSLQLAENQLSDTIPNFDKIPKLERLGLGSNMLTGSIPNFNLPVLVSLDLGGNQLTGDIPNFDKLPNLGGLLLNDNKLTGFVPNFDKLPTLESLLLFDNQLRDSIPNFNKIRSLKQLRLDNNKLTGFIPIFENLPELVELWLNDNNLKGFIPDYSIFNPHLKLSYLYNNKLTFSSLIKNFSSNKKLIEVSNVPSYGFIYFQQQKIYPDTTITITNNTNYTLDLLIDDTVTTSTYTWYKNGVLYKTIKGSNKLPFTPFTSNDVGKYTVKITNPLAPQLTLESDSITLNALPMLVCDRRSDSLELVKFYNATGGKNWTPDTIRWILSKPIDTWFGINLNSKG